MYMSFEDKKKPKIYSLCRFNIMHKKEENNSS